MLFLWYFCVSFLVILNILCIYIIPILFSFKKKCHGTIWSFIWLKIKSLWYFLLNFEIISTFIIFIWQIYNIFIANPNISKRENTKKIL